MDPGRYHPAESSAATSGGPKCEATSLHADTGRLPGLSATDYQLRPRCPRRSRTASPRPSRGLRGHPFGGLNGRERRWRIDRIGSWAAWKTERETRNSVRVGPAWVRASRFLPPSDPPTLLETSPRLLSDDRSTAAR